MLDDEVVNKEPKHKLWRMRRSKNGLSLLKPNLN
jgi:hypothetical protein